MKENYIKIIEFILQHEGYKSNDPDDSGGLTIWGISAKSHPIEVKEMALISKEEAKKIAINIYKKEYWDEIEGDNIPDKLDWVIMDTAVVQGTYRANVMFNLYLDNWRDALFHRIAEFILVSKKGNNIKYLRGWINRCLELWEILR